MKRVEQTDAEAVRLQEQQENQVISYVKQLKKSELSKVLLQLLFDGPEWQWERFIREYLEMKECGKHMACTMCFPHL